MGSLYTCTAILAFLLPAVSAQLRVQLNPSSVRPLDEPDYHPWPIETETKESTTTIDNVTFTLSAPSDSHLDGNYYKYQYTRFVSHLGERVVNKGITTSEDNPGPIRLSIEGLEEGEHSLLMWHNAWDDLEQAELGSVEVGVDGEAVATVGTMEIYGVMSISISSVVLIALVRMSNNLPESIIFGNLRLRMSRSPLAQGTGLSILSTPPAEEKWST